MKAVNSLFLPGAVLFCLVAAASSHGGVASSDWHEPQAKLRFRIEKDDEYAMIPAISLLDVQPDKKSESVWKWIEKNRWTEKRKVNGRLCLNALPTFSSKPIIYNLHRDIGQFVARGTITDGADPNTSVRFEIQNDKRTLFRSRPVTVLNPVVEINVAIPPGSQQLKLVTQSADDKYYGWARWVDPGFVLRRQYPEVSSVRICAPGYNIEDLDAVIRVTSDGSKVDSRVLSAGSGEPMEIIFDTGDASPSYLVYLASKSSGGASPPWEPEGGLVLETKWSEKAFGSSDGLSEFAKAFSGIAEPVGASLVDDIQHTFPIHRIADYDGGDSSTKGGYGLYRYAGYFGVPQAGSYSFATISNWDSYLAVDGKLVIGWPGRHGTGGSRGYKQGTVALSPGRHKLEYYNYSPWGTMYCLAAWKKPGEELRPMTRTDFYAVGRYRPTLAESGDADNAYVPFDWSVVDDFRAEQTGRSFVTMEFDALAPPGSPPEADSWQWTFDDGTVAAGRTVEHVYLRPGLRRVQLEVRSDGKPLARSAADVYVHCLWDKTLLSWDNAAAYDQAIKARNLDKVSADDIVNLSILADQVERPDWKKLATAALVKNVTRLVDESDDGDFILRFGQDLLSTKIREYEKALELFGRLAAKSSLGKAITDTARVRQAETLVTYFGKYDNALKALGRQGADASAGTDTTRRAVLIRAQAMLGLGKAEDAAALVGQLAENSDASSELKRRIKHAGLLRHARLLAEVQDDPNQWDHALGMIETVIEEDPLKLFSPNLNLVVLDVRLATKQFQAALYLAERVRHLKLNDYDRAEILTRQVVASCGLKDLDKARSVYTQLSGDYPYSPAVSEAKKAIMQTFGRP